ncbi:MAG: DnaJ domain-containing protein [Flavobacteriales bacterium]|jgi:hypothetical protein|nr:DnaJ domain-containing protein [Flavobacteriales bacterium]
MDHYATLGLSYTADTHAIKDAYRSLAKRYHPDVSNEANAHEQFIRVTQAYEILSDPIKRSRYDVTRFSPSPRSAPAKEQARYERNVRRDQHSAKARAEHFGRMKYEKFDHEYFNSNVAYFLPKMAGCFGIFIGIMLCWIIIGGLLLLFGLPTILLVVVMFVSIPVGVWLSVLFDDWHNKKAKARAEQ